MLGAEIGLRLWDIATWPPAGSDRRIRRPARRPVTCDRCRPMDVTRWMSPDGCRPMDVTQVVADHRLAGGLRGTPGRLAIEHLQLHLGWGVEEGNCRLALRNPRDIETQTRTPNGRVALPAPILPRRPSAALAVRFSLRSAVATTDQASRSVDALEVRRADRARRAPSCTSIVRFGAGAARTRVPDTTFPSPAANRTLRNP